MSILTSNMNEFSILYVIYVKKMPNYRNVEVIDTKSVILILVKIVLKN